MKWFDLLTWTLPEDLRTHAWLIDQALPTALLALFVLGQIYFVDRTTSTFYESNDEIQDAENQDAEISEVWVLLTSLY